MIILTLRSLHPASRFQASGTSHYWANSRCMWAVFPSHAQCWRARLVHLWQSTHFPSSCDSCKCQLRHHSVWEIRWPDVRVQCILARIVYQRIRCLSWASSRSSYWLILFAVTFRLRCFSFIIVSHPSMQSKRVDSHHHILSARLHSHWADLVHKHIYIFHRSSLRYNSPGCGLSAWGSLWRLSKVWAIFWIAVVISTYLAKGESLVTLHEEKLMVRSLRSGYIVDVSWLRIILDSHYNRFYAHDSLWYSGHCCYAQQFDNIARRLAKVLSTHL